MQNSPVSGDVIFAGRREFSELVSMYGAAFGLTYVSYFEGFGIPILEAMQSGVPVITSNTTSMPEVLGDAGIAVNPDDTQAIANAMISLYLDAELRMQYIENGLERSRFFSWDKTAEKMWDAIEKTLKTP
jgi:glycosyltransferase involved in cell wall biosynthesis